MKSKIVILSTFALFACMACDAPEPKTEEIVIEETSVVAEPEIDVDAVVANIDVQRATIEGQISDITPKEVSTKDLRSQISQKWSKIHFYAAGNQVIRIKTYPHAAVSKRTEEFYFDNSGLILAVIEDDGSGDKGKSPEAIDKMYYFNGGQLILERNNTSETPADIRQANGARLLQEANEYLEIYKSH